MMFLSKDGIGERLARDFAHAGAALIITTGRDDSRLEPIADMLSTEYPATRIQAHRLDLTVYYESTSLQANDFEWYPSANILRTILAMPGLTDNRPLVSFIEILDGTVPAEHFRGEFDRYNR